MKVPGARAPDETFCRRVAHSAKIRPPDRHHKSPERWQSGRMYLTRNQAYGFPVPWVRIPPSPPETKKVTRRNKHPSPSFSS